MKLARHAEDLAEEIQQASQSVDGPSVSIEEITASIRRISGGIDKHSQPLDEVATRAQRPSAMSDDLDEHVAVFKTATGEIANLQDEV